MNYKEKLKRKIDEYVHFVYAISRFFPRDERYCLTSQFRRSTLSIILNYIEGFARLRSKSQLYFFEVAYGSFQESKYLLSFSYKEKYISENDYQRGVDCTKEIGAMLWTEMRNLRKYLA